MADELACAECGNPGVLLTCENGKLYHPLCYFAVMQAHKTPVQLPLMPHFDGLWPKPRGVRKKVKRTATQPFICVHCHFEIYEDTPVRCAVDDLFEYYHAHCYRAACLALDMPDPLPDKPRARKRRAQPPVRCAVCDTDVPRSLFPVHVRVHIEKG